MGRGSQSDEELTAIGAGSTVGHAKRAFGCMLELWVEFVFEFAAVDGRTSTTGTSRLQLISASTDSRRRWL